MKTILSIMVLLALTAAAGHAAGYSTVKPEKGVVRIPLKEISDGKAHFYKIATASKEVRFFVLKSKDGEIKAAFDACDVCFREKKGYTQDGEFMVCTNCGRRFHSNRINTVGNGCNPSPLNRKNDGAFLYISQKDLESGQKFF